LGLGVDVWGLDLGVGAWICGLGLEVDVWGVDLGLGRWGWGLGLQVARGWAWGMWVGRRA